MNAAITEYDVVILGSGPAGIQAALHAGRAQATVAVLGRTQKSSLYRAHIDNYCCMDTVANGEEMLEQGRSQAEKFGARFYDQDGVTVAQDQNGRFGVTLESTECVGAWALILAIGIARNRLNVPGEKEFLGKGVSYCVDCDANFFRNQPVAVVGNESAAASGALALLLFASEVHLVYRDLQVNERLRYQVESSAIIKHPGAWVKAVTGGAQVESVLLDNGENLPVAGTFIELGAKGALELATKLGVALDGENMKYIAVNKQQETNIPGIYAAGDICGPPWQIAKAVGEGCVAGLQAVAYAKEKRRQARAQGGNG
jgi:thioredoxin reductase (NADPH)